MEALKIPEEPEDLVATQPRKPSDILQHSHPNPKLLTPERPSSRGHITPPILFPRQPGDAVKVIDMDADATPVPPRCIDMSEEATPRPQSSPSAGILGGKPPEK